MRCRLGFNFLNGRQLFGRSWKCRLFLRNRLFLGRFHFGSRRSSKEIHRPHAFSGLNQDGIQVFTRQCNETATHRVERGGFGFIQRRGPRIGQPPAKQKQIARIQVGLRVMDVDGLTRAQAFA